MRSISFFDFFAELLQDCLGAHLFGILLFVLNFFHFFHFTSVFKDTLEDPNNIFWPPPLSLKLLSCLDVDVENSIPAKDPNMPSIQVTSCPWSDGSSAKQLFQRKDKLVCRGRIAPEIVPVKSKRQKFWLKGWVPQFLSRAMEICPYFFQCRFFFVYEKLMYQSPSRKQNQPKKSLNDTED